MPEAYPPLDEEEERRLQHHFRSVNFIQTLGARMGERRKGYVEMILDNRPEIAQELGYVHGGVVGTLADTAAGHAAMTVLPPGHGTTTAEYKINFLAPAIGSRVIARGRVLKQGRTITVLQSDVFHVHDGAERLCATAVLTYVNLPPRGP